MGFYDELAGEYDTIVGAASRASAAAKFADWLVRTHAPARVLETACGTGLYAQVLAQRGVQVVAADLEPAMIARARRSPQRGTPIEWLCAPMQTIADHVQGPFDAVLCMGNSLPHLLTDADLAATLAGFRRLLRPGGAAVIQLLNYTRVLDRRERIVGITRHEGKDESREYVRFYDFLESGLVRFNILGIRWAADGCQHELHHTDLRPYRPADVSAALRSAGFARVDLFGSLDGQPFDEAKNETVMCVAS
jgi:SAM-dependent methyltransferase